MTPRAADELAPVLAWLRTGSAVRARTDFPAGTAMPDGRLDMCKQNLGPSGAIAVASALPEGGGPVRHLLLGTDGLGDAGAAAVAPKAVAAGVETLYLGCNGIGGGGVCQIADQLIASPGVVKALWLKRNPVGPDGVRAVAETVRAGTVLRTIDLTQTGLGAAEVAVLVDAMLEAASLSDNPSASATAPPTDHAAAGPTESAATLRSGESPAEGRTDHRIERLYLSGNHLGEAGARELSRLLSAGAITELYISAAHLGDTGAHHLAEGLRHTPQGTLRRLSVASNGIGPAALADLIAAATVAGVELLDAARVKAAGFLAAADNRLDESAAATVAEALAAGPHRLSYLDLRHTDTGSRGALRLLDGAQRATTPTKFMLGNGIAGRVKRELAVLAVGVPSSVFDVPADVKAIRSVHRTA